MSLVQEDGAENLVHEAETQRQYIRIELPAKVTIAECDHKLLNLSLGGFKIEVRDADMAVTVNEKGDQDALISFDFNAFSFSITCRAKPVHSEGLEIAYKFTDLPPQQVSLVRHIIKSYLSGQIFTADSLLTTASRYEYKAPRPSKKMSRDAFIHMARTALPLLFIGIAMVSMIWILGSNIYQNQRFVKTYSASVDADLTTVRAKENAVFTSLLPQKSIRFPEGKSWDF